MKKIITIVALSVMCLTSNAQLVWKISGNGLEKPSHILGTHHGCPFNYCDSIPGLMDAFDKADMVIGEIDMISLSQMSQEEMIRMKTMMMMPADTALLSLFNPEEKTKVDNWLKASLGADLNMLASLKPMTIMVTVMNKMMTELAPELATMTQIDKYMQTLAQSKGKKVGELETADYQIGLLYGTSLADQADALVEMAGQDNTKELMTKLTEAYKSQDLEKLWRAFREQMTELEYEEVVKVRNLNWEKQMKEILPRQSTLFVVGAGHLPGEFGMISLLRKAGYKVEPAK